MFRGRNILSVIEGVGVLSTSPNKTTHEAMQCKKCN